MTMTLQNLVGRMFDVIEPNRPMVLKLLAAAKCNLAGSELVELSEENRFDTAYKTVMQQAILALHANGYRTLTSKPLTILLKA